MLKRQRNQVWMNAKHRIHLVRSLEPACIPASIAKAVRTHRKMFVRDDQLRSHLFGLFFESLSTCSSKQLYAITSSAVECAPTLTNSVKAAPYTVHAKPS